MEDEDDPSRKQILQEKKSAQQNQPQEQPQDPDFDNDFNQEGFSGSNMNSDFKPPAAAGGFRR